MPVVAFDMDRLKAVEPKKAANTFGAMFEEANLIPKNSKILGCSLTPISSPNPSAPQRFIGATQGEVKARNAPNGANFTTLGQLCLISFYDFWNDYLRRDYVIPAFKSADSVL
jgi:hypothetical protein